MKRHALFLLILLLMTVSCGVGYKANRAFDDGDNATAEVLYRQQYDADPESLVASYGLGRFLVLTGKAKEAVTLLKKTLELHPRDGLATYYLGMAYLASGKKQEATEAFKSVYMPFEFEYAKELRCSADYVLGLELGTARKLKLMDIYQQRLERRQRRRESYYRGPEGEVLPVICPPFNWDLPSPETVFPQAQ